MKAKFLVVIERGKNNFSAYSPDIPGCIATGRSVESTLNEIRSAISFHLEGMLENGEDLPIPIGLNSYVLETEELSVDDILTSVEIEIPAFALA